MTKSWVSASISLCITKFYSDYHSTCQQQRCYRLFLPLIYFHIAIHQYSYNLPVVKPVLRSPLHRQYRQNCLMLLRRSYPGETGPIHDLVPPEIYVHLNFYKQITINNIR